MSPLLVAVLASAIGAADGTTTRPPVESTPVVESSTPLSGVELRDAVRAALRRWARPTDAEADEAARELMTLFAALEQDRQLASSQRQSLQAKVRGRLFQLSDQIALRVAKAKRLAQSEKAKSVAIPDGKGAPLAQGFGGFGAPAPMPGGAAGFNGPVTPDDHGLALVELIQKTIRPASWDVNGGPGSISYWYPGRALVIRQTDEVHEAVGGVLDQLQRAGR